MHYSVGVEYALHCLTYFIDLPPDAHLGVKDLAAYQGVSETYLSKTFTKLAKAGIVRSIPGVKGGYQLARSPHDISFWDVINAIEGPSPLFRCTEIRQRSAVLKGHALADEIFHAPCLISQVMQDAEAKMRIDLQGKTLAWLHQMLKEKLPPEQQAATAQWFRQALSQH